MTKIVKILLSLIGIGLMAAVYFAYSKGWLKTYRHTVINDQPLVLENKTLRDQPRTPGNGVVTHQSPSPENEAVNDQPRTPDNAQPLNEVTDDQPRTLENDEVLIITDTRYIQKNNILLKDRARLIVADSLFEHRQEYAGQFSLEARDQAKVIFSNSQIRSSAWLNWNFFDQTSLEMDDVEQSFSDIWLSFSDQTQATVNRARFHGTLGGETRVAITNSPDIFLEFVYPVGAVVREELPKQIADYSFPNADDQNIGSSLTIKNSTASSWGITVNPSSDIVIRNADPLIVTFALGEPLENTTVTLDGLRATRYQDQTWQVADTTLRLQNVRTDRWSPIAGGTNTLIVKNSDLADNAFSWGNAKIVIEGSTTSFLRAKDSVEMTVKDSVVDGDVVARDNGIIRLLNTKVKGKVIEEGNGQVIEEAK